MEPENLILNQVQEETPKIENMQNSNNSNKIIIENIPGEFEKPDEVKNLPLEHNQPIPPTQNQNNITSSLLPQNDNASVSNTTNENINSNQNYSNTNLYLNQTQEPSLNDSYSKEVSSYTPSKSKNIGKKTNREYKCEEEGCNKVFYDKCALRKHLLTHGEKLYSCQICNKKFLDNSKLRRHSLVHSGEKPFACPLCPKKFSLDFNLRTHMRIHSGEKPYACVFPGCFKRFSQSSNLSAHEKTHELMKREGGMEEINNKPIFSENPLKYIIENPYSGTETMNNIKKINEICEMMNKGIMLQMNMFNQNMGYQNSGRNHGEIPGMPIQKRTYIKKANKENNSMNNNYNNFGNNNNNIYNNSQYKNNNIYNINYIQNESNVGGYNTNNNIYQGENIFNNNNSQAKQNKKILFQIKERNNEKNEINLNNLDNNNNQITESNNHQPKKQIFTTYRDPVNNNTNNFAMNKNNNTNNTNNTLNYAQDNLNCNYNNNVLEEVDLENKGICLNEEEEKPGQENYDLEDIRDDKEYENFRKFI